jgi:uncharacterized coiled-coil protein SlyX
MQLTFAQETIATLDAVVTEQGMELQRLKTVVEKLERRIVDLVEASEDGSQKPPHY